MYFSTRAVLASRGLWGRSARFGGGGGQPEARLGDVGSGSGGDQLEGRRGEAAAGAEARGGVEVEGRHVAEGRNAKRTGAASRRRGGAWAGVA
jgi:hypothetical protein